MENALVFEEKEQGHIICSKIVNFDCTEAGLTLKYGRISPAVHWCYQNQSNSTYSDVRRCATSPKLFFTHTETDRHRQKGGHGQNGFYSEVALAKNLFGTMQISILNLYLSLMICNVTLKHIFINSE